MVHQNAKESAKPHNYNRFGKPVESERPQIVSDKYLNPDGSIAWDKNSLNGFANSKFERITLKVGTRIIRYCGENGHFASRVGTTFSELALPYRIATCYYNEYEVVQDDVTVYRIEVDHGVVAKQPAWPSERGGGEQFYFPDPKRGIGQYVGRGLRRLGVEEWTSVSEEDLIHE